MNKKNKLGKVVAQVKGYRIRQDEKGFHLYAGKKRFAKLPVKNREDAVVVAKELIK